MNHDLPSYFLFMVPTSHPNAPRRQAAKHGPRHRPQRRRGANAERHGADGARQGAAQGRARAEEAA